MAQDQEASSRSGSLAGYGGLFQMAWFSLNKDGECYFRWVWFSLNNGDDSTHIGE